MNAEYLKSLRAIRLKGLRRIEMNISGFKECDQCRSMCQTSLGICPWCHCYRFKEDADTVRATLDEMARVPYPVGSAVVPRMSFPEPWPAESPPTPRSVPALEDQNDAGFAQQRKRESQ
jgi:hypothetical protein